MSAFAVVTGRAQFVRAVRADRRYRRAGEPAAYVSVDEYVPHSTVDLWRSAKPRRIR
jgi:hypothetical protein